MVPQGRRNGIITHLKSRVHHSGDLSFTVALGLLVALGLIFLSSASAPYAFEHFRDHAYYVKRQVLAGLIPGIMCFWVIRKFRHRVLERLAIPLFITSVVLLLLVFVPGLGVTHGRTRSWLGLGFLTFQPAEIAKLGLILALAAWMTIARPAWFDIRSWVRGLLPFLCILAVVALPIAVQPDIGTLVIIVAIAFAMLFAAGSPVLHLAATAAAGIAAFSALIAAAPYRIARLTVLLHPELDPQGIGYQVNQALLAVGSGGLFGQGLGHSRQKFS
ncbi:FtsW/RodA/SpoVE family cell cycle protein, partial [Candidatus Uhrbacteria bacterium]|nr:FtsW/RodA/SpoVE family cell cycle protein [Candidatus Uhrbacteria bacterium]